MQPKPIHIPLKTHNEGAIFPPFKRPALAVVTCMDSRIHPRLPEKFAFVLRTGGAIQHPEPLEHFTQQQARALAARLGLPVVPLLYRVEDHSLVVLNAQACKRQAAQMKLERNP